MSNSQEFYRGIRTVAPYEFVSGELRARRQSKTWDIADVVNHIVDGTESSPFISITRAKDVACMYAADSGIIMFIENLVVIDPFIEIGRWLSGRENLADPAVEKAREARLYAEKDHELLVFSHIPADKIVKLEVIES